jgi:hypothetical protein
MQAAVAVTVHRVDGQDYWLSGLAVLGGVFALLALYFLAGNVKLYNTLLDLSERHQQEVRAVLAHKEEHVRKRQEPTVGGNTAGGDVSILAVVTVILCAGHRAGSEALVLLTVRGHVRSSAT